VIPHKPIAAEQACIWLRKRVTASSRPGGQLGTIALNSRKEKQTRD
jgi:hypothetical protein